MAVEAGRWWYVKIAGPSFIIVQTPATIRNSHARGITYSVQYTGLLLYGTNMTQLLIGLLLAQWEILAIFSALQNQDFFL